MHRHSQTHTAHNSHNSHTQTHTATSMFTHAHTLTWMQMLSFLLGTLTSAFCVVRQMPSPRGNVVHIKSNKKGWFLAALLCAIHMLVILPWPLPSMWYKLSSSTKGESNHCCNLQWPTVAPDNVPMPIWQWQRRHLDRGFWSCLHRKLPGP